MPVRREELEFMSSGRQLSPNSQNRDKSWNSVVAAKLNGYCNLQHMNPDANSLSISLHSLQFLVERAASDPQDFAGLRFVPFDRIEDESDVLPLQFCERERRCFISQMG